MSGMAVFAINVAQRGMNGMAVFAQNVK